MGREGRKGRLGVPVPRTLPGGPASLRPESGWLCAWGRVSHPRPPPVRVEEGGGELTVGEVPARLWVPPPPPPLFPGGRPLRLRGSGLGAHRVCGEPLGVSEGLSSDGEFSLGEKAALTIPEAGHWPQGPLCS